MSWWKMSQFIMVFFLELYQFFFLFFKTLNRLRNLGLGLLSMWSSEDGFSELIVSTSFLMGPDENFLNSSWYFPLNFINSSSCFLALIRWINIALVFYFKVIFRRWMFRVESKHFILNVLWWKLSQFIMVFFLEICQFFLFLLKIWSDGEMLAWDFLSKWYSKDVCSELILSTSFLMCYDENIFHSVCCFPLKSINSSSGCSKHLLDGKRLAWSLLSKWDSEDGCSEVILSTSFWMCSN